MFINIAEGVEINLDKCYLVHAYGGKELPKDGYLLPNPDVDVGNNRFANCCVFSQTCVFFSFNARVPAYGFERFNTGLIILIPFKDVSAQLVSVSFAECAALGPVKISSDSIIIMPKAYEGAEVGSDRIPPYYKRMGIKLVHCNTQAERNSIAEDIIFASSNLNIIQADSRGMNFPVYANITVRTPDRLVKLERISPVQFFSPVLQNLEPALSLGFDESSHSGFKLWLLVIKELSHKNYLTSKNNVLGFLVINYAVRKVWQWLNKFKNLPSASKEYFLDRMYYLYATFLSLQKYPDKQIFISLKKEIDAKYLSIKAQQNPTIFNDLFAEYLLNLTVKDSNLDKDCYLESTLVFFYEAMQVTDIVDAENFIVEYAKFSTELAKSLWGISYPVEILGVLLKFSYCIYISDYGADEDRITGFGWHAEFQYWHQQLPILRQQLYRMLNVKILPYALRCYLYSIENVAKISMDDFFNNFQREDLPRLPNPHAAEEECERASQIASADLPLVCDMISAEMAKAGESLPARLKTLKTVPELIDLLSAGSATLARLFALDAQVMQQYTIKTHTLMFYATLQEHVALPSAQANLLDIARKCENFWHLFNLAITLHDIGKGIGKKTEQHMQTSKIVNAVLQALRYSVEEISFIINLIDHDIIGEFCQCEHPTPENLDEAIEKLTIKRGLVQNLLTPSQYYYLQVLFYLSDAGSYPQLYFSIMQTTNGTFCFKYLPKYKDFALLIKRLNLVTDEMLTVASPSQQPQWFRTDQLGISREYNSHISLHAFIKGRPNAYIIENRHYAKIIQDEYDRRYGLVLA